MDGAMLSKSWIQFSVDGWSCVPFLFFDLRPNYGGDNEDNGDLIQKACTVALSDADPAPGHCDPYLRQRLLDTHRQVWVSAPFSWFLVHTRFCLCFQESVYPVLWKFWRLCGGVNGNFLQEGLCQIHVYCTQSSCPCGRPLLTHTSTGDPQRLKGRSGSVSVECPDEHKILFEPSKDVWRVWGLILNVILAHLRLFGGFSSALGRGVYFFGGIQHSPVDGHSATSCNFGL